ncbi:MAG TPA: hypothetical protein VGN21_06830 [Stellaceae bacterium]|nr:hypothetical protein [Stellaceae bacterium]
MPTLRDIYLIDARLSYLEQILAALGLINPVDPAPSDISRLGGGQVEAFRRPGPIVDPAVSDRVRLAESLLRRPPQGDPAAADRVRLAELLLRRPQPGDPAVSDRVRLAELLLRRPPHGDPPASDRVRLEGLDPILAEWIARLLYGADPPPEDIARLTANELEATARAVSEDIVRLRSIEGLLNERLKEVREGEAGKQ